MSRSRNIKPGFFKNEELSGLDPYARLLFIGLWTIADRDGRLEDRPKRIKVEIFPYEEINIETRLRELHASGFISRYVAEGVPCIEIPTWVKHQNPHNRETPSCLPGSDSADYKPESGSGLSLEPTKVVPSPVFSGTSPADSLNLIPDSPVPDSLIPDSLPEEVEDFELWSIDEILREINQPGYKKLSAGERSEARDRWPQGFCVEKSLVLRLLDDRRYGSTTFHKIITALLATSDGPAKTYRQQAAHSLSVTVSAALPTREVFCIQIGDDGLPDAVRTWNRTVESGNKRLSWKIGTEEHTRLVQACRDPEFTDNLEIIFSKCQQIIAADPERNAWLTFSWLIKKPDNWFKILHGEYDFMAHKQAERSGTKTQGEKNYDMAQRVIAKHEKLAKEQKEHETNF